MYSYNKIAFIDLVRVGLWSDAVANPNARLDLGGKVDWEKVYQLAEEQSVVGLVLAGIEHSYVKPPQELLLQWIGEVQILEQQNKAMNQFIAELIEKMRKADIYTLLVKGQGIAQCYEKPLWRVSGDVDLLLSDDNYKKALDFLLPFSSDNKSTDIYSKEFAITIDDWLIELHGSMRTGLYSKVDKEIDVVQDDVFYGGNVRSWDNKGTTVFLPSPDNDVFFVFTHFLKHFYKGGLGIRQICDWCRLLWTFRDVINTTLLEKRLRKAGLITEWKAFGSFAVDYLGMSSDAMPLYAPDAKWKKKAEKICSFIMEVGNFGHNRDRSYFEKYPYAIRKVCSLGRRCEDLIRHARIFPLDSLRFFPSILFHGLKSAARGE
jgi:hypothetical protein